MSMSNLNKIKDNQLRLSMLSFEHIMKQFYMDKYRINSKKHINRQTLQYELDLFYKLYKKYSEEENVKMMEFLLKKFITSKKNKNRHILFLNKKQYCSQCHNRLLYVEIDESLNTIELILEEKVKETDFIDVGLMRLIVDKESSLSLIENDCKV